MMLKLIFWLCFFLIFYTYFGYPFIIMFLARIRPRNVDKKAIVAQVTLLIPAYNEERIIADKIQNSLNLDYPKDNLEVIIASDGSTDSTVQIAKKYLSYGVKILEYPRHQGKTCLINKLMHEVKGEIIVFSDASGMLDASAIKEIVANFADPRVGCVCGLYRMAQEDDSLASKGYYNYLDYDIDIKKHESRFNTILGAHGALYAIRKELFEPVPENLLNEDFYIPMRIVAKGYRAVYEEKAMVLDRLRYSWREEFRRRVRIGFGNWQQIFALKGNLGLSNGLVAWQFFSHKVMRTLMPFFLITVFFLSVVLKGIIYKIFLWFSLSFILLALLGWIFPGRKFAEKFLYKPSFLVMGNIAYLVGTFRFLFVRKKIKW